MAGLQIQTRSNGETTLQEETVRKLKESLRGELIRVGDSGYDDARSIWNAMIDRRPALIASCLGVADVVTCVNFAREHDVTLSIKGGGHNISIQCNARQLFHSRKRFRKEKPESMQPRLEKRK